jgi:hypothetical protein
VQALAGRFADGADLLMEILEAQAEEQKEKAAVEGMSLFVPGRLCARLDAVGHIFIVSTKISRFAALLLCRATGDNSCVRTIIIRI